MPDTLYYDGNCPLCLNEMTRLRELAGPDLTLCDIFEAQDEGLPDRDALLRVLHLQTADGTLLTGVEANVAAWRHTRWSFLFAWMEWPLIRLVSSAVYARWASWRYRRLYGEQYQEPRDAV